MPPSVSAGPPVVHKHSIALPKPIAAANGSNRDKDPLEHGQHRRLSSKTIIRPIRTTYLQDGIKKYESAYIHTHIPIYL